MGVTPTYVYYLLPLIGESKPSFLACADEYMHIFEVLPVANGKKAMINHRKSIRGYDKIINMACLSNSHVVTCSRDPIIKLWNLSQEKELCSFTGHDMSVTAVDCMGKSLVSGGRDQSTRVWDLET